MIYEWIAIPESEIPRASEVSFQHALDTYASEVNKTAAMWRAIPDPLLDFKPHSRVNTIRTILIHQILSERRFFAEFAGLQEPAVEELLPKGKSPSAHVYLDRYVAFAKTACHNSRGQTWHGGWKKGTFLAACAASGSGYSGDGYCTPATTGRKSRLGFAWRAMYRCQRFMAHPGM